MLTVLALLACSGPDTDPLDTDVADTEAPDTDDVELAAPHCGLVGTVTPEFPVEGQPIAFDLSCADVSAERFDLAFVNAPDGATVAGPHAELTTDLDDAGVIEILVSATPRDGSGEVPETAVLRVSVADAWDTGGNVPVDPATYDEEWGFPVIHVLPHAAIGTEYVDADVVWRGESYPSGVKIRGASSASFPKPSLTIETRGEQKYDLDAQGMGHRDHLVLISNFDDNSFIRQKLVYDLWADMAASAAEPRMVARTFFVVVYVENEYQGLFTAIDRVDDEFIRDMGMGDGESSLYKAVDHDANFYATDAGGGRKSSWHQGYTKEQGEPEDDFSDLDAFVRWTAEADHATFAQQADSRLSVDEFIDWWILVEFVRGGDSGGKNSYLYHEPETGWFRFAPWDFNMSYGQSWTTERMDATSFDDFSWANGVFAHIFAESSLHARLSARWADLLEGPLSEAHQTARIDEYDALTAAEGRRDFEKWRYDYRHWWWAPYRRADWTERDDEVALVRQWTVDRAAFAAALDP